jgi:RNA polymerase sigma factor (sigma-70 family)
MSIVGEVKAAERPDDDADGRLREAFDVLAKARHRGGELPPEVSTALSVVYRITAPYLTQMLARRFWDCPVEMAEDAVGDCFRKLVEKGVNSADEAETSLIANPRAWLAVCAVRAMQDLIRRETARKEDLLSDDEPRKPRLGPSDGSERGQWRLPPDIEDCLHRLTEREQTIVQWKYEGFSSKEVAAMLGTTVNTVDVTFHSARRKLRDCLGDPE